MIRQLVQRGGSISINLPKHLVDFLDWKGGEYVRVTKKGRALVLEKLVKVIVEGEK